MKNIIFAFILSAFGLYACAQTPPRQVAETFTKQFSKAEHVKWSSEDANEWEAEFKLNGNEMSASFDNAGKWLETETEVKKKDLPAEVYKAISLEFNGWKIEEVESIENPEFKGYEIALEKKEAETEILATPDGKLTIKNVKVDEDKDNDKKNGDEDKDEDKE